MGAPSGDLQGPLSPLAHQEALSAAQEPVEVGWPHDPPGRSLEIASYLGCCLSLKNKLLFLGSF